VNPDARPLDELVDGIRERSERAFSAVYQLTASGLLSFAHGLLRDRAAAEDAVQQAFLELARAAPTMKGDGRSLRAWLYKSVRFRCLDELRRRRRRPEIPTDVLPDIDVVAAPQLPDPDLQDALSELTERHRSIVLLRHVVGLSFSEIANVLGTNRAAAYAASSRAERRLRQLLETVESKAPATSHLGGAPRAQEQNE
jgi:RNA polymerase sigma-70 factor (ECF subfamily)